MDQDMIKVHSSSVSCVTHACGKLRHDSFPQWLYPGSLLPIVLLPCD